MKKRPELIRKNDRYIYEVISSKAAKICNKERLESLKALLKDACKVRGNLGFISDVYAEEIGATDAVYRARQGACGLVVALDMAVQAMEGAIEDIRHAIEINAQAVLAEELEREEEKKKKKKKAYDKKRYMAHKEEMEAGNE